MANSVGKWAFIIGAVLALIMGIGAGLGQAWGTNQWLVLLLLVAGLVVGIVNITAKEVQGFLIASIAVLASAVAANLAQVDVLVPKVGGILNAIVGMLVLVIAPAALVVALRAVYGFAAE